MAVVLGLVGGLLEGVGHMLLQQLNILSNVWYPIIWIAALFNGLLLGVLGLALSAGLSVLPNRPRLRTVVVFILALAAGLPWLALMLKEWIQSYAIFILTIGTAVAFTRGFQRHEAALLRFFRKSLPWALGLTGLVFLGIEGGSWWQERTGTNNLPPASASAPDVLIIIIDALRADHLSSYGYERPTSPTLDRLAAQGVLFEEAYATSSYTLPSHASILTGLYPSQHGVEWMTSKTHATASYPTLAETLQGHGYRTGAFSANTFWFSREHGFGRGFLHFDDFFHSLADRVLRTAYGRMITLSVLWRLGYEDIPARKRATDINEAVLDWLSRDVDHPFFVTINYMDVHDPYLPPQPYRNKFSDADNPGGLINWQLHIPDSLNTEALQGEIDAYDGSIAYVDDYIDRLLTALQQRDAERELLVVITSDHGEEFQEHGGLLHGYKLYRELIRVPLIFWQPGRIPEGVRVPRPVTNAAIPATVMDAVGTDEVLFPGPPLQRLWDASAAPAGWPFPLSELKQRPWVPEQYPVHHGSMRSLVSPGWHYIDHETLGPELYDWMNDPLEAHNVVHKPEMQPMLDRFQQVRP